MANYDMFSINAPWVCPFRETFHASQNSVPVVKRRKGCVPSRRSVADEIRCIFELFLWVWHAAIMSSPKLTGYKMCHRQNVMKRLQFAFAWKSFLHRCCYFFYVISLWAAVGGTETANLCNRYRHWDMQMMRWIFVVAATFLFHFFFSDKTERCRLYLNECRRYKNIQATNGALCYSHCRCCWQGICTNQIANIRWTEYDKCSSFKCKRQETWRGPWDDIWNIKINNLLSEWYQIFRDLANSSVASFFKEVNVEKSA